MLSSIPESHSPHLEKLLDWDNEGVDRDLIDIAGHMSNWEEVLTVHLKLTRSDVSDIKEKYPQRPELQRLVNNNIMTANPLFDLCYIHKMCYKTTDHCVAPTFLTSPPRLITSYNLHSYNYVDQSLGAGI